MNIELLDGKAVVVQQGDNVWLLGCPVGIGAALKEAGVTPTAVLLTRVGAPGLSELDGKPLVVRATPLHIGGLQAKAIGRTHGWDYAIKSDDGSLLWTERGDVSARDVYGYSLALIGNKHRSDSFSENVVTPPWPETAQYIVSGGVWQTTSKPWTTMDDVPANVKELDDAPLTLEQANWIARVASGAGKDGKENWAIGISAFKKSHHVKDGAWVKNDEKAKEDATIDDAEIGVTLSAEGESVDIPETAIEEAEKEVKNSDGLTASDFLVVEDPEKPSTWHLPVCKTHGELDMGLMGAAHAALTKGYRGNKYEGPDKDKALAKLAGLYKKMGKAMPGEEKAKELPDWLPEELTAPGVAFKEEPNGRMRWFAHTTNDTLDLQNEVIPPEAIDWSLAVATVMDDKGPLLFRHLPIRLGGCDKQVRVGPLLFETGLLDPFDKNMAARAAVELVARQPGQWMMSPGLRFKEGDLVDGRYRRCWIAERSLTHKPANLTTAFAVLRDKEMASVTDEMLKEAAEQLGLPFEQIKALAQKYLDTQKEFSDVDGLLKALKEGVATEYAPPAEKTEPAPAPAPVTPAPGPDWAAIIQANTAAMNGLAAVVKELAAGKFVDAKVQTALEEYVQAAPQFGSQSKDKGDGDEAAVRAALEAAEKSADVRATQRAPFSMAEFEKMFTSQTLNPQ